MARQNIRRWENGGRGRFSDFPTALNDAIMQMLPRQDGGIVFGSAEPGWGVLDSHGQQALLRHG